MSAVAVTRPEPHAALRAEMARLASSGFPLLPLGGGADGKSPLSRSWATGRARLGAVLGPMFRAGSQIYGIRLDRLLVVDCDTDDASLVREIEARFGISPVHVRTPRGLHLYYAAGGPAPKLRGEGLPVDVKTGFGGYIAGPLSIRRDGGTYLPVKGALGVDRLPTLRAERAAASPEAPEAATRPATEVGARHDRLVTEAVGMVALVDSQAELMANLAAIRDDFVDAASVPDAEVARVAAWAWRCRLESRLWVGRDSMVQVNRKALDALKSTSNRSDAVALYVALSDAHGHLPAKEFMLRWKSMRQAGVTDLSRERFAAAVKALRSAGLLGVATNHRAGSRARTYRLLRPVSGTGAVSLAARRPQGGQGKAGGKG